MDKLPVEYGMPETLRTGSDEITVLTTSAETGGALFAVAVRMPPGGGPPVLHRHDPGEVYYVRAGEFTFHVDGERIVAGPGAVVPLAGGVPHTVRNEGDADAVAFVVHAPGAPMEGFLRAVAALADPALPDVLEAASRNGIELLGPIPEGGPTRVATPRMAG